MKNSYVIFLVILLIVFFYRSEAQNPGLTLFETNLPKPVGWVNDFENIFTDLEEFVLDSVIRAFKDETRMEIALVSLDSSHVPVQRFDSLANVLGNFWGVGAKGDNNGVVVAISKSWRKMRLVYGDGTANIISEEDGTFLINTYFIPEFRTGNFYLGTMNGLTQLMELLKQRSR